MISTIEVGAGDVNAATNIPVKAKGMDLQRTAVDEVSLVGLHHCNLFLLAYIIKSVRASTSGIRRDEVSMSCFSFNDLHS